MFGQNRPMLGLAAMFPRTDYSTGDGVYHVRLRLRTSVPAAVPHAVQRAA
jgi:hypothetical protein